MYNNPFVPKSVSLLTTAGALTGLGYAFKMKSGFLGYAGYFVLGSLVGFMAGNLYDLATSPKQAAPKNNLDKIADPAGSAIEDKAQFTKNKGEVTGLF